jgi:hypothetical protein
MTLTFVVLMGVVLLMELGAGFAAYKLKGQVNRFINVAGTPYTPLLQLFPTKVV